MTEFQLGHPCAGKDCRECETCIFDEDLFLDKTQPNKKFKNNMCRRLCNECVNLTKSFEMREAGRFDAACKLVTYEALGTSRARRIDFNISHGQDIVAPNWCPLKDAKHMEFPSASRPRPQDTGPQPNLNPNAALPSPSTSVSNNSSGELTFTEKRERMKLLPRHIKWEDIKEGHTYVIPKIISQSRKIVKVITKTDMVCSCHEISELTGNEYSYNCSVYPTDLDAVFITELRKY